MSFVVFDSFGRNSVNVAKLERKKGRSLYNIQFSAYALVIPSRDEEEREDGEYRGSV